MSFFGVTVETLESITPITGADRIVMGTLKGMDYQFILKKGGIAPTHQCIFFPIDSIIPVELLKFVGLDGKLSGGSKNRVKTIKMKGQISQGLVLSVPEIEKYLLSIGKLLDTSLTDLTECLGVTKYDPEISGPIWGNTSRGSINHPLPEDVHHYDIEGTDRNKDIIEVLMKTPVYITEKLEGMNFALKRDPEGNITICSRNRTVYVESGSMMKRFFMRIKNLFKKRIVSQHEQAIRNSGLIEAIHTLAATCHPYDTIIFRGEVLGPQVQNNIYHLDKLRGVVFDIQMGGEYLSVEPFLRYAAELGLSTPPMLWCDDTLEKFLGYKTIAEMSDGISKLFETKREGIVIKPMVEETCKIGRMFLKKRSPEYLNESDL